jgi:hypothetical protein
LAEIAPDFLHPRLGKPLSILWDEFRNNHPAINKTIHAIEFSWD